MIEEMAIKHCAPTLAGLKTGNAFVCSYDSEEKILEEVRGMNIKLSHKGVRVFPLSHSAKRALIYVFRPCRLKSDLLDADAKEILSEFGYDISHIWGCISRLSHKVDSDNAFPHEIGLFLGYPPADVRGFIKDSVNGACRNCKAAGCWKVYGDEKTARLCFARFKKCHDIYIDKWRMGSKIEKLTVPDFTG